MCLERQNTSTQATIFGIEPTQQQRRRRGQGRSDRQSIGSIRRPRILDTLDYDRAAQEMHILRIVEATGWAITPCYSVSERIISGRAI